MKYLPLICTVVLFSGCGGSGETPYSEADDYNIAAPGTSFSNFESTNTWEEATQEEYIQWHLQPSVYATLDSTIPSMTDTSRIEYYFNEADASVVTTAAKVEILSNDGINVSRHECTSEGQENSGEWLLVPTLSDTIANTFALKEVDSSICESPSVHYYQNGVSFKAVTICQDTILAEHTSTRSNTTLVSSSNSFTSSSSMEEIDNSMTPQVEAGCGSLTTIKNASGQEIVQHIITAGFDQSGSKALVRLVNSSQGNIIYVDFAGEQYAVVDGAVNFYKLNITAAIGDFNFHGFSGSFASIF